jgi:G3E family GTPase
MSAELRPVTVLTGFLGSGKTTTLARLLKAPEFAGTVAIINEFGEIGLDHLLIETSEERFALLDNGCVCCTVRDDLVETLLRLSMRAATGELPPFRRVAIETTGLADPAPILHALMADERLAAAYAIDGVVTTVDAANGLATLAAHVEAVKQVAVADRLLLTKADLVDAATQELLLARLSRLNPSAEIVLSRNGDAPAAALVGAALESRTGDEVVDGFRRASAPSRFRCEPHGTEVSTFCLVIDEPIRWAAFKQWLEYLAMLKGEDLLRFKGLIHIAEKPETPIVVHGVQHVFHPPRELERWSSEDRRTRLVFITRAIPRATIESTLSKFVAIDARRIHRPAA